MTSRGLLVAALTATFTMADAPNAWADLLDENPPLPGPLQPGDDDDGNGQQPPSDIGKTKKAPPKSEDGDSKAAPNKKGSTKKAAPKGNGKGKETTTGVLAPKSGRKKRDRKDLPVHFESLGLKGLRESGRIELVDNVIVTQGTLRMEADQAVVYFDEEANDVARVVAEGHVKIFEVDEDTGERLKAFGDTMTFDNNARKVVLSGNARLWRGTDQAIRGKRITYELDTGWIRADRVEGEVKPTQATKTKGEAKGKTKGEPE